MRSRMCRPAEQHITRPHSLDPEEGFQWAYLHAWIAACLRQDFLYIGNRPLKASHGVSPRLECGNLWCALNSEFELPDRTSEDDAPAFDGLGPTCLGAPCLTRSLSRKRGSGGDAFASRPSKLETVFSRSHQPHRVLTHRKSTGSPQRTDRPLPVLLIASISGFYLREFCDASPCVPAGARMTQRLGHGAARRARPRALVRWR